MPEPCWTCGIEHAAAVECIAALKARVAELERDKARLDWLSRRNYFKIERCHDGIEAEAVFNCRYVYLSPTLRETIDQAMADPDVNVAMHGIVDDTDAAAMQEGRDA